MIDILYLLVINNNLQNTNKLEIRQQILAFYYCRKERGAPYIFKCRPGVSYDIKIYVHICTCINTRQVLYIYRSIGILFLPLAPSLRIFCIYIHVHM